MNHGFNKFATYSRIPHASRRLAFLPKELPRIRSYKKNFTCNDVTFVTPKVNTQFQRDRQQFQGFPVTFGLDDFLVAGL
jgi:hypothetical protein